MSVTKKVIEELLPMSSRPRFQVRVWPATDVGAGDAEPVTYCTPVGRISVTTMFDPATLVMTVAIWEKMFDS